jgi:hypothetical protein
MASIPSMPPITTNNNSNNSGFNLLGMAAMRMEDNVVSTASSAFGPHHYGLHILIRQWVSIATLRRSFGLMARASSLAAKCGISFDDIFANESPFAKMTRSPPMTFLKDSIIKPASQQRVSGPRLQFNEIPSDLLKAVQLHVRSEQEIEDNRWIIVRLIRHGTSRYFLSPGFEKYVATFDEVQTTWEQNKREVKSLWLEEMEVIKYSQSFTHQISSLKTPSSPCTPCKIPGGTMIFHNVYPDGDMSKRPQRKRIDVEFLSCMKCPDIDTMYLYVEYKPKHPTTLAFMPTNNDRSANTAVLLGASQKEEDDFLKLIPDIEATDELADWWTAIAGPSVM